METFLRNFEPAGIGQAIRWNVFENGTGTTTLGMVATQGQELFRLICQNRLEWQAELTASEITQIQPTMDVNVSVPDVATVRGKVRSLAPSLDKQHRNGLVYVDLSQASKNNVRAGMFAHGEFNLGSKKGITIG